MRVTSRFHAGLIWAIAFLMPIVFSGCGIATWREVYCSNQPHGNARACVQEKCGLADCSVEIAVKQDAVSELIGYARGCVIDFAQAAWVGSTVGVFVDGGTCQQIRAAYDLASKREVPFSAVEGAVRSAIIKEYGVSPNELKTAGGDIFKWATYPGDGLQRRSKDEFSIRYPH
jgi:hypothetical protein